MFLVLRIVHVVTGIFWAGTVFFLVSFLIPSMQAAGPGAGPVQAELARRKLFTKLPVVGLLTVLSGFWLYFLRMRGGATFAPTNEARVLGIGGVAALAALIYGVGVGRPNMIKADALAAEATALPAGAERDAKLAQAMGHRKRTASAARVAATLIGVTVVAMAVARYV